MKALERADRKMVSKAVFLKTRNLNEANSCIQEVVKEGLIEMMMDTVDPSDEIDDHYYYSSLMGMCMADDEIIKPYLGSELEDNAFIANPGFALDTYCHQIRDHLKEIFYVNREMIWMLYATMEVKDAEFIREFNGTLLLLVKGNYHENPLQIANHPYPRY